MQNKIAQALNRLLEERGVSATDLAVGAGVSNATVSKLRRADHSGAVSFNVVLKIAKFFNVPLESFAPDDFGGKTYQPFSFQDVALQDGAAIYDQFMARSLNAESIYISNTLPDALKTQAVILAELGDQPFVSAYAEKMRAIRENPDVIKNISGAFFVDESIMLCLLRRQGIYAQLTENDAAEQIEILNALFETAFPRVHGYVIDFRSNNLSTCFVVNQKFGAQFVFGGYLTWESEELGQMVHKKAMSAARKATGITQFISAHR